MSISISVYLFAYIYTHIYIYMYVYMYVCMHVCMEWSLKKRCIFKGSCACRASGWRPAWFMYRRSLDRLQRLFQQNTSIVIVSMLL